MIAGKYLCGMLAGLFLVAFHADCLAGSMSTSLPAVPTSSAAAYGSAPTTTSAPTMPLVGGADAAYVLGVGDKVKLTVYGEDDLSGEYEISSTGSIALPLIGETRAAGNTLQAFETAVRQKLSTGYLKDPKVSAQVVNYRPFFILGEVAKPGSYPYVNGMNVLNAVAMAGGYTYRADKSGVTVVHANDPSKKEYAIEEEKAVQPGDILRVPERFF